MINWDDFFDFFTTGLPSKVLYPSLVVALVLIVMGGCGKVRNKGRYTLFILLAEYLFVVICSTIICRNTIDFEFERLQLSPFWTYKAVISHTPGVSVWDIVLNVVLFSPLGFLVKLLKPSISLLWMMGIAICFSVFIESNQYFFEKGAAQIDDVMHNVTGALLGWLVAKAALVCSSKLNFNTLS